MRLKKKLEKDIAEFLSTEIEWLPLNLMNVQDENKDKLIKLFDTLDEDDDVQSFFSNASFES